MTDIRRHCDCPGWNPRCQEWDCPRLLVLRTSSRVVEVVSGRRRKWRGLVRQLKDPSE